MTLQILLSSFPEQEGLEVDTDNIQVTCFLLDNVSFKSLEGVSEK